MAALAPPQTDSPMRMAEFIERLSGVLDWQDNSFSNAIHEKYYRHLAAGLEPAIEALAVCDPDAAEAARLLLETLTPAQRPNFIAAPHIAAIMVDPEMFRQRENRSFFLKALGITAGCLTDDDAPLYNERGELANGSHKISFGHAPSNHDYRMSFAGDLPIPFMDRGGNSLSSIQE